MRKKDRRKAERLKAYHLVKCKVITGSLGPNYVVTANIRDIGAGGTCITCEDLLSISDILELKINFPALHTPISTLAKVVWIKQFKNVKKYEVGAQFIEIEEAVRRAIEEQVRFVFDRLKTRRKFSSLFSKAVRKGNK